MAKNIQNFVRRSRRVTRETVAGERSPIHGVQVYVSEWDNVVHLDVALTQGDITESVGMRITQDAARKLIQDLTNKLPPVKGVEITE